MTAALTDARHIGKVYEVTGPRAITFSQAVAEISKAVGRQIRYTQTSGADFAEGMRGAGVPDDVIHLLDELFTVTLDGRNREVQSGVMEARGRPAISPISPATPPLRMPGGCDLRVLPGPPDEQCQ